MINKTCTRCGETKPLNEFSNCSKHKDGHLTNCKSCMAERMKDWERKNPEKRMKINERQREKKGRAHFMRYYARRKLKAILRMGGQCQECGFKPDTQLEYGILQFHHKGGNSGKEGMYIVMRNIINGQSEDYMLLCANCHIIQNHVDGTKRIGMVFLPEEEFRGIPAEKKNFL